jgi:hypothetical protein
MKKFFEPISVLTSIALVLLAQFCAPLRASEKSADSNTGAVTTAPPVFKTMTLWLKEIHGIKPGFKLLYSKEYPDRYIAIYRADDYRLAICEQFKGNSGAAYDVRDADGRDLLDLARARTMSNNDLCKDYHFKTNDGSVTYRVLFGSFFPYRRGYTGVAHIKIVCPSSPDYPKPLSIDLLLNDETAK